MYLIMFLLSYMFFNFLTIWSIEKYGLSATLKFCSVMTIVGVWGRYFIFKGLDNFALTLIP